MDKGDLFGGNAPRNELAAYIIVNRKLNGIRFRVLLQSAFQRVKLHAVDGFVRSFRGLLGSMAIGCGNIAENELRQLVGLSFIPYIINVIDAHVDLAAGIVGEHGVDDALIEAEFSAVRGYFQHVVHGRVNRTGMD
ncbi:hypothetical protein SDC9_117458 [bioreactor metagenome]|uniref:Uncharacterized protein n=1 Tax=bioreactor metagenome TaxID=1076179 RepID=A0A645C587_9ZZZZ